MSKSALLVSTAVVLVLCAASATAQGQQNHETAMRGQASTLAGRLTLTTKERMIVLRDVGVSNESTLGLNALTEGGDVPRAARILDIPATVVQQIPKLRDYRYFTADHRVAIVQRDSAKIDVIIEDPR